MTYTVRLTAPRVPIYLGPAAEDVRFPTSLTSDGSDAMYVLDPSILQGFAVGD